jgi:hypothetical protein
MDGVQLSVGTTSRSSKGSAGLAVTPGNVLVDGGARL